jgi:hypothetical protein
MEKLDKAILDWIAAHTDDTALYDQLQQATVLRRDYMRTGYFIYFHVPDSLPLLSSRARPLCPDINATSLAHGAGTTLFVRNGKIHYLEIYARGGFFPEQPDDYHLVAPV